MFLLLYAFRRCLTAGCVFRLVAEMGGFGLLLFFLSSKNLSYTIFGKHKPEAWIQWMAIPFCLPFSSAFFFLL